MNFVSPLTLLLFLPLGGIIVLLYLLKPKRKERMVSSVLLWQQAMADIQAAAPFQKLKKSLLLILQITALFFLVFAVARPIVRSKSLIENRIVVVLDSSASMQATDVATSRFADAKRRALDVVDRMGPGNTMLVMTAGAKTRVAAPFTSDKKVLAGAISKLKPTDTECDMRQALVLAQSLVSGKSAQKPRIVILSDGGFMELGDASSGNAKLEFVRIGKACDNVAITGLDCRKTLSGDQQVFVGLRNYSKSERKCDLEITIDGSLADVREETLAPGAMKQEILSASANAGGRVTAKLDIKDDLAADNSGSVYLTKRRNLNVLMVSKGNIFLQNALNLDPRTQLTRTEGLPADFAKKQYDLVVFDRIAPPSSLPPGGYLLLATSAPQGPADAGDKISRTAVVDSAQNHPATQFVQFADVRIAEASYLKPKAWAERIVEGEGGALAVAGAKDGRRFVQLGFSLLETDFPLRVGFPIFVTNTLEWLAGPAESSAGQSGRAGKPISLYLPPDATSVRITRPDGSNKALKVTQTPFVFDATEQAGVYKVDGKGIKQEFSCNLASMRESDTLPKKSVAVGGKRFTSTGRPVPTNREFYAPFILLVLGILAYEWYVYHRGI